MTQIQHDFVKNLFMEMQPKLLSYATAYFKDTAQAEDAVQELFMRVCENVDKLMTHNAPSGWIYTTLKNIMHDAKRDDKRGMEVFEKIQYMAAVEHSNNLSHPDRSSTDLLYGNIVSLKEYKLLQKVAEFGYSLAELAKEEGISVEACKKKIQRAKKILQKIVE